MLGYQLKWQTIPIAGGAPLMIRSLLDKQQYHDPDGQAMRVGISSATWSLFGQLWPSAHVLAAQMMARDIDDLRGQHILEIGCGLGLASLVAHRRGADVCASDAHPLAQVFLNANTQLNHLPYMDYSQACWGRDYPELGQFDLIIGSDVLYERDEAGVLAGFIQRHALPHCEVIIIDPNRGNRAAFQRHMQRAGFELSETKLVTAEYRGRILRYRR